MSRPSGSLYFIMAMASIALATLAVWRGSADRINPHVLTYYVVNYGDGLIRRALVGEVYSWFVQQKDLATVKAVMTWMYTPLLALLLAALFCWVAIVERRRRDYLLLAILGVFLASQFVPTLAYDVGFLDVFDYLLVTIAAASLARRRYAAVVVAGAIGPLIHEAFIFCWLALVPLVLWERPSWQRVAVLLVPLVSTAGIYFCASPDAAVAQIRASVLPDADKELALNFALGQTVTANVDMLLVKYRNYLANALAAGAFFTLPAAIVLCLYGAARRRGADIAILICATAAPLLILTLAWDLSRFLVSAMFFALIAVLYMETVRPAVRVAWYVPATGWLCAALLVQVPFTYAYFEAAHVADVGPARLRDWPAGRLMQGAVVLYSRAVGPVVVDRRGDDSLPAGDTWYVEEDIWRGAWVRRPGTNVFDAVMTLPVGMVVTYTATVERDGDTIIARRNVGTPHQMDYVGRLHGRTISGNYAGGYWSAKIQ